jgi:hypothetical protein
VKHARTDYDERIQDSAGLIPKDEPVLLIRGQDQMAITTIEFWIAGAKQVGVDKALIEAMEAHRRRIIQWQAEHGNKVPDAPADALR